jgi:hypothetical protein
MSNTALASTCSGTSITVVSLRLLKTSFAMPVLRAYKAAALRQPVPADELDMCYVVTVCQLAAYQ